MTVKVNHTNTWFVGLIKSNRRSGEEKTAMIRAVGCDQKSADTAVKEQVDDEATEDAGSGRSVGGGTSSLSAPPLLMAIALSDKEDPGESSSFLPCLWARVYDCQGKPPCGASGQHVWMPLQSPARDCNSSAYRDQAENVNVQSRADIRNSGQ